MPQVENRMTSDVQEMVPDRILQLGMGFWPAKVLLVAVRMNLFSILSKNSLRLGEIQSILHLHGRGLADFLDALVSLGLLKRDGGLYSNTVESEMFLNRSSSYYVGGMLEMGNDRLYGFWGNLEEGLRTGSPQNEIKDGGNFFDVLYSSPEKTRIFQEAMIGLSAGSSKALVNTFDFGKYSSFCDVGGGPGCLAIEVAGHFPKMAVTNFDFPQTKKIFQDYLNLRGMNGHVRFVGGNCLSDEFPSAEIYALGHVLHGWGGEEESHIVLRKIFNALPPGGCLLVIEALIDDDRKKNSFGLLMSLDMMLETEKGRNFTGAELTHWVREAGFDSVSVNPLVGPYSYLEAYKKK